jgi:hypothetical protein
VNGPEKRKEQVKVFLRKGERERERERGRNTLHFVIVRNPFEIPAWVGIE